MKKPVSCALKEVMKELQQHDAFFFNTFTQYLIRNTEKETGTHILMFYKSIANNLDLDVILGVTNPRYFVIKRPEKKITSLYFQD